PIRRWIKSTPRNHPNVPRVDLACQQLPFPLTYIVLRTIRLRRLHGDLRNVPRKLGAGAGYVSGEKLRERTQLLDGELTKIGRILTQSVVTGCQRSFYFRQLCLPLRNGLQQKSRVPALSN